VIHLQIKQLIFTQEKYLKFQSSQAMRILKKHGEVMGGEDWEMWIDALKAENLLLLEQLQLLIHIGPSLTEAVYRKEHW
jgi:trans-2-enoyl-CoA reductase